MTGSGSRFVGTMLPLLMMITLTAASARADNLTGQVVDTSNTGVAGADVEASGPVSATTVTDANGFFTLVLPAGTYDVEILPQGTSLAALGLSAVAVSGTTSLGQITLQPGFVLSGTVDDSGGLPVANADINVYDQATGTKLLTPDDNTGLAGAFAVVVPAGTYTVRASPPATVLLVAQEIEDVAVNGTTSMGTITLPPGFLLTGTVVDAQTQAPIADVDIDVDHAVTGRRVITPGDNTNAGGVFAAVVPFGLYHVSFDPDPGVLYAGREVYNVFVSTTHDMGVVTLQQGFAVTGTLTSPSGAVAAADIDVDSTTTGARVYVPHDETDANGSFSIVLPAGSYIMELEPPVSAGLVGTRTGTITVNGPTTLSPISVQPGFTVSGTVQGWNGSGESGAQVDFIDPATGEELITPGNETDSGGAFSAVVPSGTWDVEVQTAKGSLSRDTLITGFPVAGPASLNPILNLVPVGTYISGLGIPTVPQGGPIPVNVFIFNPTMSSQNTLVSLVVTEPGGGEITIVPPSAVTLTPQQLDSFLGLPMPLPPVGSNLQGLVLHLELRFADPATGMVFDKDRLPFIVQ